MNMKTPLYNVRRTRKWWQVKLTVSWWLFLLVVILLLLFVSQLLGAPSQGGSGALEAWNGGAALAAHRLGCKHLVRQHAQESVATVIGLYDRRFVEGDCLLLWPESGGERFFLGYGGDTEAGNPIHYLSDTPRIRIWNGKEAHDHDTASR